MINCIVLKQTSTLLMTHRALLVPPMIYSNKPSWHSLKTLKCKY